MPCTCAERLDGCGVACEEQTGNGVNSYCRNEREQELRDQQYVDLQQKMDYIEYAASTQEELDKVKAAIAKAEAAPAKTWTCTLCGGTVDLSNPVKPS